jgi:hypothetical protein
MVDAGTTPTRRTAAVIKERGPHYEVETDGNVVFW